MTRLAPTARPPALSERSAAAVRIYRDRVARMVTVVIEQHGPDAHRALRAARALDDAGWHAIGNAAQTLATPGVRTAVLEEIEARVATSRRGLLR